MLQHLLHMKANRFSANQITNDKKFKRKQTYYELSDNTYIFKKWIRILFLGTPLNVCTYTWQFCFPTPGKKGADRFAAVPTLSSRQGTTQTSTQEDLWRPIADSHYTNRGGARGPNHPRYKGRWYRGPKHPRYTGQWCRVWIHPLIQETNHPWGFVMCVCDLVLGNLLIVV